MLRLAALLSIAAFSLIAVNAYALEVGDHAPCTSLSDVQPDGSQLTHCINDRPPGVPYVVLDFFSITCGDCVHNLPTLSKLAAEISGRAQTRQVAVDRDETAIRRYLRQGSPYVTFPVAMDLERQAKNDYGIRYTPTVLILDADDRIVYIHESTPLGATEINDIKSIVNQR